MQADAQDQGRPGLRPGIGCGGRRQRHARTWAAGPRIPRDGPLEVEGPPPEGPRFLLVLSTAMGIDILTGGRRLMIQIPSAQAAAAWPAAAARAGSWARSLYLQAIAEQIVLVASTD